MKREPYPTLEQFDKARKHLTRPAEVALQETKTRPAGTF